MNLREYPIELPKVSIVVIGRNEAKNLPDCMQSIRRIHYPQGKLDVIYVDTNSTDNSVKIARQWGVRVAEENSSNPSAGLARNRGLREAKHDVIHFVDADTTVASGYLKCAVQYLGKDNVVCVIGRLDEKYKRRNLFSWILYYSWAIKKPGFVEPAGAGGTFVRHTLLEVDGYTT